MSHISLKTSQILYVIIANAITYGFATIGKTNVQKTLQILTALWHFGQG
ncbi:hypothetical protein IFE17_08345 [Actinobacillus sp. GY-402]|nr:hypothetical protein IFE17_08345 [Actinobacillus sp. GY-402]